MTNPTPGPDTSFTVIFTSLEGGYNMSQIGITLGSKITKPVFDPIRDGYTFDGWYRDTAYTNAWNFETDIITSNITLYAKWTPVSSTNPWVGTWVGVISLSQEYSEIITVTVDETSFIYYDSGISHVPGPNYTNTYRGTYTHEGNTGIFTIIEYSVDGGITWILPTETMGEPMSCTIIDGLLINAGIAFAKQPTLTGIWNQSNGNDVMLVFADMTFTYLRNNEISFESAFKGNIEFTPGNTLTATITNVWVGPITPPYNGSWSEDAAALEELKQQLLSDTLVLTGTVSGMEAGSIITLTIAGATETFIKQ